MLVKIMNKNAGSITIEAVIILPIVLTLCLVFFTLTTISYTHAKVQIILNRVCKEISYESYLLYESGITESFQEMNSKIQGETLTYEDLYGFKEYITTKSIEEIKNEKIEQFSFSTPLECIDSAVLALDTIQEGIEIGNEIKGSIVKEGIYYISTSLGRKIVKSRLDTYLKEADLDIEVEIVHLELFTIDQSGVMIINYDADIPFNLFDKKKMKQVNSGYIHLYAGYGNYNEKFNKDIKLSTYGEGNNVDEDLMDEDGFYKKVYMSENGAKYHKNPLCFHIKVNAFPVLLSNVNTKRPCSHCCSDVAINGNIMVFTTLGSNVYHTTPTCYSIYHKLTILSEKEAIYKGYDSCGTCSR